jgi:predicted DNA-binding protein with PD1-like motif
MNYTKSDNTYVLVLNKGEEVLSSIIELCQKENITAGSITGIGATNYLEASFYDTDEKKYYTKKYEEDLEILALNGNITMVDNLPNAHLHILVSDVQGRALGGHLSKAIISVTCEIFIHALNTTLNRQKCPSFGINLISL